MLLTFGKDKNYQINRMETIKYMLERAGEDDGVCKVIYFDKNFNGALQWTNTPDLIACYLGEDGSISFSAHSEDDNEQTFPITLEELPERVQMMVIDYLSYNYNWQEYGEMSIHPNGGVTLQFVQGAEGNFYKNTLNFEQKRGICYVSEHGFEELNQYYEEHKELEGNLTEEQLLHIADENGMGIYSSGTFYSIAKCALYAMHLPDDEQSVEKLATHIFNMVEWESPSTYVYQLEIEDVEEILERNNDD